MGKFQQKKVVIGDIHGQLKMLRALIDYHGMDNHFVFLGDYIDRGPDAKGVVDLILSLPDKTCLRGNHEDLFIIILKGPQLIDDYSKERHVHERNTWMLPANGGTQTLRSFGLHSNSQWTDLPVQYRNFFDSLILYYEDQQYVYVHAGLQPDVALEKQTANTLLWIRDAWISNLKPYQSKGVIFGHSIIKSYPNLCNSQGLIVHADTKTHSNNQHSESDASLARNSDLQSLLNRALCIGIDTGAYHTGILTSLVIDELERPHVFQFNQLEDKVLDMGALEI